MVRAGATYYSDEYAVIDDTGLVHPFARPLGIREEGSYVQTKCAAEALGVSYKTLLTKIKEYNL